MTTVQFAVAAILAILILRRPYLGIVFTVASLPIVGTLPRIAVFTSVVPLIGGVTLIAFLLEKLRERQRRSFHFGAVHLIGFLFILWIIVSNPHASWYGFDRNWVITFVQLWVTIWLAGELLDNPHKHYVLMWTFSIFCILSALLAIQRGSIGGELYLSRRAAGLVDEPDIAALYFIVGTLFLNHLRTATPNRILKMLALVGAIITLLGVFYTISRTGILLVFTSLGLLISFNTKLKYRFQILVLFILGLFMVWFLSENIVGIVTNIVPAITHGTDTAGLRYSLWKVGWKMWLDNPFAGVGIGRYPLESANYGQGILRNFYLGRALVTHNMYIQVLAETGIVGFALFALLLVVTLWNFGKKRNIVDQNFLSLRNTWLIVYLVVLLCGITLSIHYEKLLWISIGVSAYFSRQFAAQQEDLPHISQKLSQKLVEQK